ncbi:MAG: long-chain-acyl-CoA synthetase [Gammaproteobacteria bacterium]|jgi:citronellyl-CoA synthetase|nr:long-chain-acyl-CoA synthetase [Gammaproteobacteria bacterium]MBT4494842.1 long-chain-acyl-CoA synthetase [Gammaproteobacteria bacterium]MBT7369355.1 long-chain-acyl-CoA synthetase [Gammaproteobacteria bacterium]
MGALTEFIGDLKVLLAAATAKQPELEEIASFALLVEQNAEKFPDELVLICEDDRETWRGLNERANRVANLLKSQGVEKGDCVSLFMQNRIEFVVQAVAICKLGAIAGLINTNLTKQQLTHCITLTESKKCIFGEELTMPLNAVRAELKLKDGVDFLYVRDQGTEPAPNWAIEVDSKDSDHLHHNLEDTQTVEIGCIAFYIFTSGTTGMPKAARISHRRLLTAADMSARMLLRINEKDRMYNCLPLYHGTGLMIGLTAAFTVSASTVMRRKLSVSAFWDDIRQHNCTSFIYIGEILRYLLAHPESPKDPQNQIRAIVGNGLRPDIWHDFKNRFDIQRMGEFYGASEGNAGFANVFNKDCTVGLSTAPAKVVAYDIANDEIIRDENGYCIEVPDGEPGLLLIEITGKSEFEGYTNSEATEKKVLRNALVKGDAYFNSGDLMKVVDVGFSYGQKHYQFVDRIGDTFRWKSENVSTNEVGEILNQHDDIVFTNIYGVEIPGTDGRAGMAAIVLRDGMTPNEIDLAGISSHIVRNLPGYARPVFIRLLEDLPTTSTHKLQKNDLRDQAFHLDHVNDHLFVLRPGEETYSRLDSDFYDQIIQRSVAF